MYKGVDFLCISLLYRYSSQLEALETDVVHQETTAWKQTQTTMEDESIHVVRPEISIEDIQNSDEKIQLLVFQILTHSEHFLKHNVNSVWMIWNLISV